MGIAVDSHCVKLLLFLSSFFFVSILWSCSVCQGEPRAMVERGRLMLAMAGGSGPLLMASWLPGAVPTPV